MATVGAILVAGAPHAHSAVYVSELDPNGRFAHLAIANEITAADATKFEKLVESLAAKIDVVDVELNSAGGDVAAAMRIGRIIRSRGLWTIAPDDAGTKCASACVLILAAGVVRIGGEDSRVVIHRPYFQPALFASLARDQAQQRYAQMTNLVRSYLSEMGMPEDLFKEMLKVPSDEGRVLSYAELQDLTLVGWDPAYQEWLKAKGQSPH